MRAIICVTWIMAIYCAGCGPLRHVGPEQLRAQNRFQATYTSAKNYQVVFKAILGQCLGWESRRHGQDMTFRDASGIQHQLYCELKEGTISRQLGDDLESVIAWLVDISAVEGGGCTIQAYAVNGDHWEDIEKIIRRAITDEQSSESVRSRTK